MKVKVDDSFSEQEVQALMQLGFEVERVIVLERKIVHAVVTCVLCKTITQQYLLLAKYSNGITKKKADISEQEKEVLVKEGLNCEQYKASVKACWACESVLEQKEKTELINMILKLYAPIPTRKEVVGLLKELRIQSHD